MPTGSRAKKRRLAEDAATASSGASADARRSPTPSEAASAANGDEGKPGALRDEDMGDLTLQTRVEDFKTVLEAPENGVGAESGQLGGAEGLGKEAAPPDRSASLVQIQQLQNELLQLEKGNHARFVRKRRELEHTRRRRVLAAQNFRNHQYRNFDQLYDFDVINASAAFDVAKEQLRDAEKSRLEAELRQLEQARQALERKSLSGSANGGTSARGTDVVDKPKEKERETNAKGTSSGPPAREGGGSVFLHPHLSEADIRDDLQDIVADLQDQARAMPRTQAQERQLVVPDRGLLQLDGVIFMPGDLVQATSVLSGEDFDGIVSDISPGDECVYLMLLCGRRCRLRFRHLRVGRMVLRQRAPAITHNDEILRDMEAKGTTLPPDKKGEGKAAPRGIPKLRISVGGDSFSLESRDLLEGDTGRR